MAIRKKVWVCFVSAGALVLVFWNFLPVRHESTALAPRLRELHRLVDPQKLHHLDSHRPTTHAGGPQQNCNVQLKPWFVAGERYEQIQLIFYRKPIMQALKHICVERGWKMALILQDGEAGLRELHRLVSQPNTFTILFTISRNFHEQIVRDLANSTNALVSAVRYAYTITGAKRGQLTNFRSFFNKHGCSLKELGIMPRSFLLDDSKDCIEFFKYSQVKPLDSWWILKPSKGYGGEGITIHKNMTHFYKNYATCSQTKEQFIVQEYLSDILLIEGRKFDVRALVLIAGTSPYILFYHEGYLRLSMKKFDTTNGDSSMHLTNSHIQTLVKDFSPDKHFWSFQRFQDYLDIHHPENNNFVSNRLEPYIKKVSLLILQTGLPVFKRDPSAFHLLGLDFMVTTDFHVWFIEVNGYPLWPKASSSRSASFIDEHMNTLGKDMFDMLFALRENPSHFHEHLLPGQYFKSFQLIWSEAGAQCHSNDTYDPCSQFSD